MLAELPGTAAYTYFMRIAVALFPLSSLLPLLLAAGDSPPAPRPGSAPVTESRRASAPSAGFSPARDWPRPARWKKETIPFPLEFAPAIAHRGTEELRFAPGMFKPAVPGYWSYAFVWWVEDRELQSWESLQGELNAYFQGLITSVAAGKKLKIAADSIHVTLHPLRMKAVDGWQPMNGEATLPDAFSDGRTVQLGLWLYQKDFPAQHRRAVMVLVSPAAADASIWVALQKCRAGFKPAP